MIKLKGLPYDPKELKKKADKHILGRTEIVAAIRSRRKAIRAIRDSIGDNRCWADDPYLNEALEGSPKATKLIEGMTQKERQDACENFWKFRKAAEPDPKPRTLWTKDRWDKDLTGLMNGGLLKKLIELQEAIARHRDVPKRLKRMHKLKDDRDLFAILPEHGHVQTDFRLPPREEFLGLKLAPNAGCVAFWEGHEEDEAPCSFLGWAPCGRRS